MCELTSINKRMIECVKDFGEKERENYAKLHSYSVNENYSGRRHCHLSRTTFKKKLCVCFYLSFVHCVNYISIVNIRQRNYVNNLAIT